MARERRYRLLCPIARALDRVGDRWTLLILRDLHAGPARFSDLQTLPGLASNLLTNRLRQLEDDGLIRRRDAEYGATVYELTELGERTRDVLFDLAALGADFPPDREIKRPGNLRTVAVTLRVALERTVDPETTLRAELVVDGEPFTIDIERGEVAVQAGRADDPEVVVATEYEPMVAAADGRLSMEELAANHVRVSGHDVTKGHALLELIGRALRP